MTTHTPEQLGKKRLSEAHVVEALGLTPAQLRKLIVGKIDARQRYSVKAQEQIQEIYEAAREDGSLDRIKAEADAEAEPQPEAEAHPGILETAKAEVAHVVDAVTGSDDEPSAESTDGPTKPLDEALVVLHERNIKVTLEQAMSFLGKTSVDDRLTLDEFRRLGEYFRTKVSPDAELEVVVRAPSRFSSHRQKTRRPDPTTEDYRIAGEILELLKRLWDHLDDPPVMVKVQGAGMTGYRCKIMPENTIEMEYLVFRQLSNEKRLSAVSDKTVATIARMIESLSQYRTHGIYCGFKLDTFAVGDVRSMMSRRTRPPLMRSVRSAEKKRNLLDMTSAELKALGLLRAKPFEFKEEHPGCIGDGCLVSMMVGVETEFVGGEETPAQNLARVARYKEELVRVDPETGKSRLQHIMDSENVYDRELRQERPLKPREIIDRMRAVNANLTNSNQKEANGAR